MTVFNFGSINIDYVYRVAHLVKPGETIPSESMQTVLGGKGANQSVALARAGAKVCHLGRVSINDRWAIASMDDAGVNSTLIETVEASSGHAIIQVDAAGENAIVLHGGANQSFDKSALEHLLKNATAGDWLLVQNECNALDIAFDIAKDKEMHIAFNPAPMTPEVSDLPLEQCAVLIVNELEAQALSGTDESAPEKIAVDLCARFPQTKVVLTLGAKGAMLCHQDRRILSAARKVNVVDTTGAGDTFVGYFLASLMEGMEEREALDMACAAAALSVTKSGATPSIPVRQDVNATL